MALRISKLEQKVQLAKAELRSEITRLAYEADLTYIEQAQLYTELAQSCLKYALRIERHGDDSTPAGLDKDDHDED